MKIDPNNTWTRVEERLATETDPILRRNLETVLAHMRAEASLDLDALMDTVSERAHYHFYGEAGAEYVGKAAVRQFYVDFAASDATRLEFDVDRLVVDKHCVVTEGIMRMAYPGKTLREMGIDVDDADAYYLYEARMNILWPFDENGKAIGEDSYTSGDGFAGIESRKLSPADIGKLNRAA